MGSTQRRAIVGICLWLTASTAACRHEPTGPEQGVTQRWLQSSTGFGIARPAVSGELIILGTGDGRLVARDRDIGTARWSTQIGPGAVGGSNVLVAGGLAIAPALYVTGAVDIATGALKWQYEAPLDTVGEARPLPGYLKRSVIDTDGERVFIPAWGASVSAVSLRTGLAEWIWQPSAVVTPAGAVGVRVDGDIVFVTVWHSINANVTRSDGWLVALDRLTGRELWRFVAPREVSGVCVYGAPAIWQRLVIFNTCNGYVYAVDRDTHVQVWQAAPPLAESDGYLLTVIAGPILSGDIVYVDAGTTYISALRASDGTRIWRGQYGGQAKNELTVSDKWIYVPDGKSLSILDRQTGLKRLKLEQPNTTDGVFGSPVLASGGRAFVGVNNAHWSFDEP